MSATAPNQLVEVLFDDSVAAPVDILNEILNVYGLTRSQPASAPTKEQMDPAQLAALEAARDLWSVYHALQRRPASAHRMTELEVFHKGLDGGLSRLDGVNSGEDSEG